MEEILIKGGIVVTGNDLSVADVLVSGGKITGSGKDLPVPSGALVIGAGGRYILPGGIDPHVHMHLPTPAGFSTDDFETGSLAALSGGTTTLIDFITPCRGESIPEAVRSRKREALQCLIDYSFHASVVEWHDRTEQEVRQCITDFGLPSFKLYMAYRDTIGLDDESLLNAMQVIARQGGIAAIHCEDGPVIEDLRHAFFHEGKVSPLYHPLSRPPEAEASAVKKVIALVERTGCPVYLVHISSALSLEPITLAQQKGLPVFAETCPQYLLLDDSLYDRQFGQACAAVISPPLRKREDAEALWQAIRQGVIRTVGTDHCPFDLSQKMRGRNDFRAIPNGAGGVEHRTALLYTYGVLEGRISFPELVRLTTGNPARIFGLDRRKGSITKGLDADLCIWDPGYSHVISARNHIQRSDLELYEGMTVQGRAEWVIAKGIVRISDGRYVAGRRAGEFLERQRFSL